MNRYSPYYDADEDRTIMSIDNNGSWVHIKYVEELLNQNQKLQKLLKMAEDEAVESDDHARKQERRADNLEAELEMALNHPAYCGVYDGALCSCGKGKQ